MRLILANLAAISAQVACLVVAAGVIIRVLRVTSPKLNYALWRSVLLLCLALPWLQTPRNQELTFEDVVISDATRQQPVSVASASEPEGYIDWVAIVFVVLAGGAVLRFAWLAIGLNRLQKLRVGGERVPDGDQGGLQEAMRTRADVRYVSGLNQPATYGFRAPVVLLPERLRDRPDDRRAVLAHELVHVSRRDWLWHAGEEALRAVCWFHPALWWAITCVQMAREEVVDAAAVAVIGDRRAYMRALVSFAEGESLVSAPAFARRRHLFHRIVLLSTEEPMSARRIVMSAAAAAVVLAAGSWSSIAAFPIQAMSSDVVKSQPGPVEQTAKLTSPENPVPAAIHQQPPARPTGSDAQKADVSVTLRTVVDAAGNVAEVRLTSFTLQLEGQVSTLMGGPQSVASLRSPVLEEFIAAAAHAIQQSRFEAPREGPAVFTVIARFTPGEPVAEVRNVPMVQRVSAEGAIRVGEVIRPPVKIKDMKPVYPEAARAAGIQGVVIMEVRIEGDGRVGSAAVVRSVPGLDEAALDAVYQWEFQPTLLNGAPVPVIMMVTVQFAIPH
jgi:protein TonB